MNLKDKIILAIVLVLWAIACFLFYQSQQYLSLFVCYLIPCILYINSQVDIINLKKELRKKDEIM